MTLCPRWIRILVIQLSTALCLAWFAPGRALAQASPCNLNQDAAVNVADVQLAVNMLLGLTPCTANLVGPGICNSVVLQRIVNAAQGATCLVDNPGTRIVQLNWTASVSPGVVGYNVYRGATAGGPYTKLNPSLAVAVNYTDNTVQSGVTYHYVVTAVNSGNAESGYSNMSTVVVPF